MIKIVEIRNLDLNTTPKPVVPSRSRLNDYNPNVLNRGSVSLPHMGKLSRKKKLTIIGILVVVLLFLFVGVLLPFVRVYKSAQATYVQAQAAWAQVKTQNIDGGISGLDATNAQLTQTQNALHAMAYAQFIPIIGWYYSDADHLIKAGFPGISSARVLLESIKPYQDVLGLKGKSTFVQGTAQDRIQTAVTTLSKITPQIDTIAGSLQQAKGELDQVDPNHYPPIFGLKKVHDQLASAKTIADEGITFVYQARPLVKLLPSLLGNPSEKKYLVIFQNDKELRPTGGFMTAYGIFSLDNGVIHVDQASDMYNLDNEVPNHPKAPAPILKYLPLVYTFNLRDSNLSPDFLTSMNTFMSMYNTIPGRTQVDGIVAIDTHVLVSVIKDLDNEVDADGIQFTSQTDPRCDCPQAIYELESVADTPHSYDLRVSNVAVINSERKDIIGSLLYAIMDKALKSSPKKYWGPLVQTMLTETSQKHVQFDLFNQDAQTGIEALNAAGQIKPFDGDYLAINDTNFGGDKANLYVQEDVEQDIAKASDGSVTDTLTIHYKNPKPPSDCNLEHGNLCLNGDYRDWLRIYTPQGSQMVSSKGSEVTVTSSTDLGKTVFEGFLTVHPLGIATFTITYKLPFKVSSSDLPLLIQKQGGTDGNAYIIKVNGSQQQQFNLTQDQELKLNI